MDRLDGKVAVVTGGGNGIGRAIVHEFAAVGMLTVVADIEADKAEAVAEEARLLGAESIAVEVDVADFSSVVDLADRAASAFGNIHVLCNNAGVLLFKGFTDAIIQDWQWVYGVNVMGVINGITAFLPGMLEHGEEGHIFNTSSIAALGASGIYGTSKAAILALTDSLADELSETPINVSALFPGMVSTQIVAAERNRPADMGRRTEHPTQEFAGVFGLDPATCAIRVRDALHTGQRYVFASIPEGEFDLDTKARRRFNELMGSIADGIVPDDNGSRGSQGT